MGGIDRCVSWYLVHSFLYYQCDTSLISDDEYDMLCKRLFKEWSKIKHKHKKLLDKDSLKAGSGFHLRYKDYPMVVKVTAFSLLDKIF